MVKLRFAARDPGAANVLAAVIARLPGHQTADVWALPRAGHVFTAQRIGCRVFDETFSLDDLARAWMRSPAATLVTGTSHYRPFEPRLWELARSSGARALALVDQWTNLATRFTDGWPDAVGVIDEEQARELAGLDCPARVLIVGVPFLQAAASRAQVHEAKHVLAPGDQNQVRVLLVSESIANDVRNGTVAPMGFDEIDLYQVVRHAAERAAAAGLRATIAVRLHPYEDPQAFLDRTQFLPHLANVEIVFSPREQEAWDWIKWADLVVGVSSMLLMEAMLLGRPVVSVQPGLSRANTFIPSTRGYVPTLTDASTAGDELADWLMNPDRRGAALARQARFVESLGTDRMPAVLDWIGDCDTDGTSTD